MLLSREGADAAAFRLITDGALAALLSIPGPLSLSASATGQGPLCGFLAGTAPHVTKVLWIFMENQSYGSGAKRIPGNPSAPYPLKMTETLLGLPYLGSATRSRP
jgi:hypothetical protein